MKASSAMINLASVLTTRESQTALAVARTQGAAYAYAWKTDITLPDYRRTRWPVRVDVTFTPAAGYQVFLTPCGSASVLGREGLVGGRVPARMS